MVAAKKSDIYIIYLCTFFFIYLNIYIYIFTFRYTVPAEFGCDFFQPVLGAWEVRRSMKVELNIETFLSRMKSAGKKMIA